MKIAGAAAAKKLLEKRLKEVCAIRDKLRDDISEFEDLKDDCEQAYDNIQSAIDKLSELA